MYSGFASKGHEQFYNRLVFKLVELLQEKLIEKCNQSKFEHLG